MNNHIKFNTEMINKLTTSKPYQGKTYVVRFAGRVSTITALNDKPRDSISLSEFRRFINNKIP